MVLNMMKSDVEAADQLTNTLEVSGNTATLVSKGINIPEAGFAYTRTVSFVKEDGWKIDKIATHSKSKDTELSGVSFEE